MEALRFVFVIVANGSSDIAAFLQNPVIKRLSWPRPGPSGENRPPREHALRHRAGRLDAQAPSGLSARN